MTWPPFLELSLRPLSAHTGSLFDLRHIKHDTKPTWNARAEWINIEDRGRSGFESRSEKVPQKLCSSQIACTWTLRAFCWINLIIVLAFSSTTQWNTSIHLNVRALSIEEPTNAKQFSNGSLVLTDSTCPCFTTAIRLPPSYYNLHLHQQYKYSSHQPPPHFHPIY